MYPNEAPTRATGEPAVLQELPPPTLGAEAQLLHQLLPGAPPNTVPSPGAGWAASWDPEECSSHQDDIAAPDSALLYDLGMLGSGSLGL